MKGRSTRVILCDDHQIVRIGLKHLLAEDAGIEVVDDVSTAQQAIDSARRHHPDVAILDIGLPDKSGIAIVGDIMRENSDVKILMLTMHDDIAYLRESFAAGALGYVVKAAADTELIRAVYDVARGTRYVHPALGAALLNSDVASTAARPESAISGLSVREAEILRLLALGYTNLEMAQMLALSVRTVETYRYRLQQKLGLRSRAELARLARDSGLTS